jgi:predicted ester cyclase
MLALTDLRCRVEDITENGDKVWARAVLSGTHEGEFMGVEPTGNRVEFEVIDIARFENGKGAEHWGVSDAMSLI